MRRFLAALGFLTIVPLPAAWLGGEAELARAAPTFPFVGLLLGLLAAAAAVIARAFFPPLPAGALLTLALLAVSGALHLDGLADTADGFLSSRPRERILEIMKDSRIGAMGATAIAGVLLLKTSALVSVGDAAFWRAAFLMPLAGRCAIVFVMSFSGYARPEGGLGGLFFANRKKSDAVLALLVLAAAGWGVAGWRGLTVAAATAAVAAVFTAYSRRKIGGATGDTLGASCELAETLAALVFALRVPPDWPHRLRDLFASL